MKRRAALAAVLMAAMACGEDTPTTPTPPATNTGPILFTAQLSAANQVPPIVNADAEARGQATITVTVPRSATGAVTGNGTATYLVLLQTFPPGTVVTAAHVHAGTPGTSGAIVVETILTPATGIALPSGAATLNLTTATITAAQASQLAANPAAFYFDVHTSLNIAGAIRGQLTRPD